MCGAKRGGACDPAFSLRLSLECHALPACRPSILGGVRPAFASGVSAQALNAHSHDGRAGARLTATASSEWFTAAMKWNFGIFDHLDRNDLPLRDYYEQTTESHRALRPLRLLRLSRCRTSLHAAWHGAIAQRVPVGDRASARNGCASARSSMRCRSITRCGCWKKSACSTT